MPLQKDRLWSGRTLPTVSKPTEIITALKTWERNTHGALTRPPLLKPPRNFSATGLRGGIQLSWRADTESSGYDLLRSDSGDFSNPNDAGIVTISLPDNKTTSYFDTVGGTGGSVVEKRWYRIRSRSGGSDSPHGGASVQGPLISGSLSGPVWATSIDPTDTTTTPTVVDDVFAQDPIHRERNRYRSF